MNAFLEWNSLVCRGLTYLEMCGQVIGKPQGITQYSGVRSNRAPYSTRPKKAKDRAVSETRIQKGLYGQA